MLSNGKAWQFPLTWNSPPGLVGEREGGGRVGGLRMRKGFGRGKKKAIDESEKF